MICGVGLLAVVLVGVICGCCVLCGWFVCWRLIWLPVLGFLCFGFGAGFLLVLFGEFVFRWFGFVWYSLWLIAVTGLFVLRFGRVELDVTLGDLCCGFRGVGFAVSFGFLVVGCR